MSGFQLPFGVKPVNPIPVDYYSGPYVSNISIQDAIDQANVAIPVGIRFKTMEVRLIVNNFGLKYWYKDGTDNTDLVEVITAASSFYLQGGETYSHDTTSDIYRTGSLSIGTSSINSSKLYVYATQSGAFRLEDGSQGDNYILTTSGTSGVASWTSSAFITEPISLTYSGLQNLVNTNSLELGRRYILANYLHKYQILGSDSGAITQYHTMIGRSGNYLQFNNVPSEVALGAIITATSVPLGGTIVVGATFSVFDYFNYVYIRLSPNTAANNANFGTIFSFQKQRYPNVPTDSIILDNNSKIVMKKGGVINIDVHDGTDYMSMSASQNPIVQTEQLVLTAISDNQFSTRAESLTYPGDIVDYRFDNSNILDEDGNTLGIQRSGFIIGRYNNNLNISMDKDWRSQRYRRYKIDSTNWTNLTLSGSSSTLYTLGGNNYGGVINTSLDDGHKYILRFPYEKNMYLDFYSSTNTDTFRNGETASITPGIGASGRLANDIENTYNKSITTNGATYSDLKYAFDYPIIPMTGYNPKSLVIKAQIKNLTNTIFKDLNQKNGLSDNYELDINSIENSTVGTGTTIFSTEDISYLRTIEYFGISNYGKITNLFVSYIGNLTNHGKLYNCRISGNNSVGSAYLELFINNSIVYNSIFGFGRLDSICINNSVINRSMFLIYTGAVVSISGNIYHTSLNSTAGIYSTLFNFNNFNVQRQISSTQSKGLYGVKHTISSDINNLQIDNYNPKLELVSKVLDINYGSLSYNIIGVTE